MVIYERNDYNRFKLSIFNEEQEFNFSVAEYVRFIRKASSTALVLGIKFAGNRAHDHISMNALQRSAHQFKSHSARSNNSSNLKPINSNKRFLVENCGKKNSRISFFSYSYNNCKSIISNFSFVDHSNSVDFHNLLLIYDNFSDRYIIR